jgi:hypothetical protein
MPKDPTKNIFQYKIRGGHLNEFEFQQNQGDVTEQKGRPWEKQNFDPNAKTPESVVAESGKGRQKTAGKQAKPAAAGATKKAAKATKKTAKKAPKKAAKKAAAATKKPAARKSASKKSTGRKAGTTGRGKKATKK